MSQWEPPNDSRGSDESMRTVPLIHHDSRRDEMKRILTIQDISCLGKCSLTIALPVLSAIGVETVILPTALLSTHTMFKDAVITDLADRLMPIVAHWKKEGIRFDAVYTGYLGNPKVVQTVTEVVGESGDPAPFLLVDPVMGDHGRLYQGFDDNYVKKNRDLCAMADLILPNLTEAAFLTGTSYPESCSAEEVQCLLKALTELGAKKAVLTGISLKRGETGAMGYDRESQQFFSVQVPQVPAAYHGTGDLFASVTAGSLLRGLSLEEATELAARYTAYTIEVTRHNGREKRFGLDFEKTIPQLLTWLEEIRSQSSAAVK